MSLTSPAGPNLSAEGTFRQPSSVSGDEKSSVERMRRLLRAGERTGPFQPAWGILRSLELVEAKKRQQERDRMSESHTIPPVALPRVGVTGGGGGDALGAAAAAVTEKPKKSKKKRPAEDEGVGEKKASKKKKVEEVGVGEKKKKEKVGEKKVGETDKPKKKKEPKKKDEDAGVAA